MTKQDLVNRVSNSTYIDRVLVSKTIESALVEIRNAVAKGDSVFIRKFGTLQPKVRKQKLARNIGKGTDIIVPMHKVPHFKPAAAFKQQVKNT